MAGLRKTKATLYSLAWVWAAGAVATFLMTVFQEYSSPVTLTQNELGSPDH